MKELNTKFLKIVSGRGTAPDHTGRAYEPDLLVGFPQALCARERKHCIRHWLAKKISVQFTVYPLLFLPLHH